MIVIVNSKFIRKTDSRFESYFEIDSKLKANLQKKGNLRLIRETDSKFKVIQR